MILALASVRQSSNPIELFLACSTGVSNLDPRVLREGQPATRRLVNWADFNLRCIPTPESWTGSPKVHLPNRLIVSKVNLRLRRQRLPLPTLWRGQKIVSNHFSGFGVRVLSSNPLVRIGDLGALQPTIHLEKYSRNPNLSGGEQHFSCGFGG